MEFPLQSPPEPPLSFNISPKELLEEAETLNKRSLTVLESITSSATVDRPTFDGCIEPFIYDENKRLARSMFLRFHASTSTDKSIRDASSKAAQLLDEHNLDLYHNGEFGAVVQQVWKERDSCIQMRSIICRSSMTYF